MYIFLWQITKGGVRETVKRGVLRAEGFAAKKLCQIRATSSS